MVYITGDIHRQLSPIYNLFSTYNPSEDDIIVLLGDVGINYIDEVEDSFIKNKLKNLKSTFFCIHGNHENRPQNIKSYHEIEWHGGRVLIEDKFPNILFPVDGDIFELDGKQCIVIGGAYSVDKFYRLSMGMKWWSDEQPSEDTKRYVEKQIKEHSVDVVFSHTCPYKYIPTECFLSGIDQTTVDNSTERWLDKIEDMLDYKAWYLGHWHTNKIVDKLHFLYHDVETL
jgi:3-oxoacid CoA-transferase subunit A